jgi:ankyrin repeat protein
MLDLFKSKETKFFEAAVKGKTDRVIKYIDRDGFSTGSRNEFGMTALHIAAREGHIRLISNLFDRGADINALNQFRRTPLYMASAAGKSETVEFLLDRGANINLADKFGRSPLVVARANDHFRVVELLQIMTESSFGQPLITDAVLVPTPYVSSTEPEYAVPVGMPLQATPVVPSAPPLY